MEDIEYVFKALSDIWTGDADRKNTRTINTGLLGSIRWWFELVVRGLNGFACDPTNPTNRCPSPEKKPTEDTHHCVVCDLFGCTGWARKFRFEVLDTSNKTKVSSIKKGEEFIFRFIPLRPICQMEKHLLNLTLKLIADYGAIGGKIAFKPISSTRGRQYHRTYGIIELQEIPQDFPFMKLHSLEKYVTNQKWRNDNHDEFKWASLKYSWFIKKRFLNKNYQPRFGSTQEKKNIFKKIFTFNEKSEVCRTFGFVKPEMNIEKNVIIEHFKGIWPDFNDQEFLEGKDILYQLLAARNGGSK
ncbi:type III-B CRISPR module RAMP protein Cmr1 [Methylacidiphilum caldifontis]|nr:type III-B CRISPR module RAMP protein Cmr1 [Methylacidiphilum caldifontis]